MNKNNEQISLAYENSNKINGFSIIIVSAYIAAQMLSDIASLKIGVVAGLSVDMGTFIYPITFTLRDVVHKYLGKKNARLLVILAGIINLLMAFYFLWISKVPGSNEWGLNKEFKMILSPVWRIVIASILAEVASELIDTEVYHWFVTKITKRYQWLRVIISNSVSLPVDNFIFVFGAFSFKLSPVILWEIFIFNFLIKYGMTIISIPLIYIKPFFYKKQ